MDENEMQLAEMFKKEVYENTLRMVLLLIRECKDLDELTKKIEAKLSN